MTEYYQGPNNSAKLKAVTITFPVLVSFFVVWRICWRIHKKVIGLSDYLLVLGLSLAVCLAGFNLDPYFRWGYGYHKSDIPPEIQKAIRPKLVFFKATAGVIKLSIGVIYMHVFSKPVLVRTKIARVVNFVLMGVIFCYYFGATLVSAFQCSPVRKSWETKTPGKCIKNDQFRIYNAYINAITSIALVILPIGALASREHQSRELWQFFGLISIGLAHTGCAICRIVQIYTPNPGSAKDPQWYNTTPNTIAMAEIFTALLVATIITMRPCFKAFGLGVVSTLSNVTRSHGTFGHRADSGTTKRSGLTSTTLSMDRQKRERDGFNRIAVTTELEVLQSGDRSTEDLVLMAPKPTYELGGLQKEPVHFEAPVRRG